MTQATLDKNKSHVLIVDYAAKRMHETAAPLENEPNVVVHFATCRIEAASLLFHMASAGVYPRAVVVSWLLAVPESRRIYSEIGRELDHTCFKFVRDVLKIDEAVAANIEQHTTIVVCGASDDDVFEAHRELAAAGLAERVGVVRFSRVREQYQLHGFLFGPNAERALTCATSEDYASATESDVYAPAGCETTRTRRSVRRLSDK